MQLILLLKVRVSDQITIQCILQKFGLQLKATLENVTNVRPVGDDFRWYLKVKWSLSLVSVAVSKE